jgi:hypothetical protein
MEEVANNLSATINQHPNGVHVRVRPLQVLTPESLDWAKAATKIAELELTGDQGTLFLLAR